MTLSEAREDLYEILAKNSELDPDEAAGAAILDRYLNRAYKALVRWKVAGTRRLRFPVGRATALFSTPVYTGTATSGGTTTTVIPTTGLITDMDYYQEWVLKITSGTGAGQARVVVGWDGATGTLTTYPAWGTSPSSDSVFLLTKRFRDFVDTSDTGYADGILLDPETEIAGVLKITELNSGSDLELAEARENFSAGLAEVGEPGSFFLEGGRVYFEVAPDQTRWYRIEYERVPTSLTQASDEFQIPEPWDQLVVLMARWWVLIRYGEVSDAYSAKRDYQEMLGSLGLPGEDLGDRTETGTGRRF